LSIHIKDDIQAFLSGTLFEFARVWKPRIQHDSQGIKQMT